MTKGIDELVRRLEDHERNTRKHSMAAMGYWLDQWRQLARDAVAAARGHAGQPHADELTPSVTGSNSAGPLGADAIPRARLDELLAAEKQLTEFQDMAIRNGQQAVLLGQRVQELEDLLRDAADYLDTDKETTIGHGSILHRSFREAALAASKRGA